MGAEKHLGAHFTSRDLIPKWARDERIFWDDPKNTASFQHPERQVASLSILINREDFHHVGGAPKVLRSRNHNYPISLV